MNAGSTRGVRMGVYSAMALLLCVGASLAQPAKPAESPPATLPSDDARARLKAVEENASLAAELKARLVELYTQAVDDFVRAEEWSAKAAGFEKAKSDVPTALAEIQAKLSEPVPEAKPDVPPDASVARLEQLFAGVEAELKTARENATSLDQERKRRSDRRTEVPAATAKAKQSLDETAQSLASLSVDAEPAEVVAARKLALQARQQSLEQEIRAYEAEVASYDARGELLTARRDKAAREVARFESLSTAWRGIIADRRRQEAAAAAHAAEKARREAARAHPVVRQIAEENAVWAERRTQVGLADKIEQADRNSETAEETLKKVSGDFASIQQKVGAAGLTHAMGLLLRRHRETLPEIRDRRKSIADRESEISRVQVELIELYDVEEDLAEGMEALIRLSLAELATSVPDDERQEVESAVRELLQARRGYVAALYGDYDSYSGSLLRLHDAERELVAEIERFRAYIDERVLWVRSASPPRMSDVPSGLEALGWLTQPDNWSTCLSATGVALRTRLPVLSVATLTLIALGGYRRRMRVEIGRIAESASRPTARSFAPTLTALAMTILLAVFWPLLLALVGWCMSVEAGDTGFGKSIGTALEATALAWLLVDLFRQLLRPGGLGESHFGWPARTSQRARRHLAWLIAVGAPLVFLVIAVERSGEVEWHQSLGRMAFVAGQVLLALFVTVILRPHGPVLGAFVRANPGGWIHRLRYIWHPLAAGIPLMLAVLAITGFHYTALVLATGVHTTVWLILGLIVLNGMALRWLLVSRRHLAIEQARQRRAAAAAEGEETTQEAAVPVIDLGSIDAQTRSILRTVIVLGFFGGIWIVWAGMLPALGILDSLELWSTWGKVTETISATDGTVSTRLVEKLLPVTAQDLLLAVLILATTFVAGKNAPGLLEIAVLQRLPLKAGERYAVATVAKYAITVVGVVVGFKMIGIGWAEVQWLAAAMVVGLGFGLQEIFANFVSGLILLFERPIRIGDTVTVGSISGEVTRIQIRATTITDWDRKELVIPNKEFVTGQVINWTLSDSILRVIVPVGIAYGSDTAAAERILHQLAEENELVLPEPKPRVLFVSFGDSALGFELRVHISSVEYLLRVRHELNKAIDGAFRKAGIEIAFPQRDIHIRSIKDALPIEHAIPPGETT